ncbi:hypothetical protein BH11PLA1_BH11PLA1_18530 [soil metagenome]
MCTFNPGPPHEVISTGLPALDATLPRGGLALGGVHEWIGLAPADSIETASQQRPAPARWTPPLTILSHLCGCAARHTADALPSLPGARSTVEFPDALIVWIGAEVWPYAPTLADHAAGNLLTPSIFVQAVTTAERLWATDLALRAGATAVVADAGGFDLSSTRRLQLAAESSGALCLLTRPPWEEKELSAATTRWRIAPHPRALDHAADAHASANITSRRWTVELLRCKGLRPAVGASTRWLLEHDHAARAGLMAADLRDGSGLAAAAPPRRASG